MNIVFMGTPDFAVPCLQALVDNNQNVVGVFSQPDKPVGRKQILTPTDVKKCAIKNNLNVFQPKTLKDGEAAKIIKDLNPDIIVVVAYGKILPKEILQIAKYGCINVHASLLPYYRGAAPIQWAVLNGDTETGVTVMQMDEGLDTGDMLLVKRTIIDINETSADLFEKLSKIGSEALIEALELIESNNICPIKQEEGDFGYAKMISKELSPIDWSKSAFEIHNKVRGLQTWPVAITKYNGKNIKIHKTVLLGNNADENTACGEIIDNNKKLIVSCGDKKCLEILEVQLEGKKRMSTNDFLLGNNIEVGTVLGG